MKCLSTRFNLSYWLLPFLLFTCSIAKAQVSPPSAFFDSTTGNSYSSISEYCNNMTMPAGHVLVGTWIYNTSGWTMRPPVLPGSGSIAYQPPGSGTEGHCRLQNTSTQQYLNGYGTRVHKLYHCGNGSFIGSPPFASGVFCQTCPPGYVDQDGQCVLPPPDSDCPAAGTRSTSAQGWITTGDVEGSLSVRQGLCTNNTPSSDLCQARCVSGVVGVNSVSGESRLECGMYEFTGAQCDPADVSAVASPEPEIGVPGEDDLPPERPEDCPPGTGFAQINNFTTCLPSGSEMTGGDTNTTSADGTTTNKTTTTTINPDGTQTHTTQTDVSGPNGQIGSGTSTTTTPLNQGREGGKQENDPGPVPILDLTLPEEGTIPTTIIANPVFDTNIFAVSAACPAPITFSAMDQDFAIEFEPLCDLSPVIRGIILMLASIIAIRVVVTG